MGYLIEPDVIITKTVIIPEADAQIMDITPYTILGLQSSYVQCISVTLTGETISTPYAGFDHLYLKDDITSRIIGIYDETSNGQGISVGYVNFMLLNMKHPPNVFGAFIKANGTITLQFSQPITQGDGDIYVNFAYRLLKF